MKYLPRFLQLLRDDADILNCFSNKEEFGFIQYTVELFYKMQVNKFTNQDMAELYKRGMTYKELEKVSNRQFQSISASLSSRLTEADKNANRHYRKLWVSMMNYVTYVYETDKAGTWETLQEKFPEKSLSSLKQMYRLSGGYYMLNKARLRREAENAQIKILLAEGMSCESIANALNLPIATIYYRVGVIQGTEEETNKEDMELADEDVNLEALQEELDEDSNADD